MRSLITSMRRFIVSIHAFIASSRFFKFAMIGGVGFLVDCLAFMIFHSLFLYSPLAARTASFIIAAHATWLGNRTLTFKMTHPDIEYARLERAKSAVSNIKGVKGKSGNRNDMSKEAFVLESLKAWRFDSNILKALVREWGRYMLVAVGSALPNFLVFHYVISVFGEEGMFAFIALASGVAIGLISNYTFSCLWVFKRMNTPTPR